MRSPYIDDLIEGFPLPTLLVSAGLKNLTTPMSMSAMALMMRFKTIQGTLLGYRLLKFPVKGRLVFLYLRYIMVIGSYDRLNCFF
jgi:hypothetical protein